MNNLYSLVGIHPVLRKLLMIFILVLSIGYFSGICLVSYTTKGTVQGVRDNYLGNEDSEEATEMKFRKSTYEILSITHTHIISLSIVFLSIGLLLVGCPVPVWLRNFLIFEPFASILITFGGIFLMWNGIQWLSVVVYLSGLLMNTCFAISAVIILYTLVFKKEETEKL